ncbi:MAG: peptidoglycan D,D-transpeptidase FtsI family protein, partial [Hyphomonadaceae bacterium]
MRPQGARYEPLSQERVIEAAPARGRIRVLAFFVGALFLVLAARASQLSVAGNPVPPQRQISTAAQQARGDLTDRTGALLATNIRAYTLTAQPALVWDAAGTAAALKELFSDLDLTATERRLRESNRQLVYIRRGLTPRQRMQVMDSGLAGLGVEEEERRVYPMGSLAGHVLGYADRDMNALAGVERGLDADIREAGAHAGDVRLSIDARIQHAVEAELAAAARALNAQGGAAIVLNARTGETLALASWPSFDPNHAGEASIAARLNRAAAARYEMGSTFKPFMIAAALDERVTSLNEPFDLTAPFEVDGRAIRDTHVIEGRATLRDIIAQSSNIGAARLALRLGAARQRDYLSRLGLYRAARIELPESGAPIAPQRNDRLSVAILGYGHGLAVSTTALAGAFTVFANDGMRVEPTLRMRAAGARIERTPVFSQRSTRAVLGLMR